MDLAIVCCSKCWVNINKCKCKKGEKEMEKPTYTKEMHERGDLPPVGSEVIVSNDDKPSMVLINKPDRIGAIVTKFGCEYEITKIEDIKPIPSQVDGLESSLIKFAETKSDGTWRCIAEAIINGDIDISKYIKGDK